MKNALLVVLLVALLASACIVAPPAPAPTPQVIVVTATPKPVVVQPSTKSSGSSEAERMFGQLPSGWRQDGPPLCPTDSFCAFNDSACSYLMFHLSGSRVVGLAYGVDFQDEDCDDGAAQATGQWDALTALGLTDAVWWLGENVPSEDWDGSRFESACGGWWCGMEMDEADFLMFRLWFE